MQLRMLLWLFWTNWRQNRNYWDFNLCIWCVKRLHNDRDSIPYALALDNLMPFSRQFQKLSKRFVVPYVAGIFQLAVAIIMMFFGTFDLLTDMLVLLCGCLIY